MSQQEPPPDNRWAVTGTGTTWGSKPGDALAPPPTPAAPEIPMSRRWPWTAAGTVVLVYGGGALAGLVVVVLLVRLVTGGF